MRDRASELVSMIAPPLSMTTLIVVQSLGFTENMAEVLFGDDDKL